MKKLRKVKRNKTIKPAIIATNNNVYPFLEKAGYKPDDILPFVVAPQPSLREVFELGNPSAKTYGFPNKSITR